MAKRTKTDTIVVHCSATQPTQDIGADTIRKWHKEQGWQDIGYHLVIRRNGMLEFGRKLDEVGAHVQGHNATSVGICLVGGIDAKGKAEDNFTPAQYQMLRAVLNFLAALYPNARKKIVGHRDLSPDKNGDGQITPNEWIKECPCFDVRAWLKQNPLVL